MTSRAAWRRWLEKHHAAKSEVWIAYYKKHTGKPCVSYEEAVEEALCFGWIDGQVRRLDDDSYAQRFTPRRSGSQWSTVNLRRFERLRAEGRVTAAGLCETLRLIEEGKAISADASKAMLDILHQQRFRSGIPAGLPEDARVAHTTRAISPVAPDAGIVYLDGRDAYVVVILTEWAPEVTGQRQETIARISRAVYEYTTGRQE